MKTIELRSGDEIPVLGLGTWKLNGEECTKSVKKALELGYRHIDTADGYGNHREIAPALKETNVAREDIFITSKIRRENLEYEDVLTAGDKFLNELGLDYLDLLLIHWPNKNIPISETLKGLKELKDQGKIRNIGVSNFTINHLKEAMNVDENLISVNQVEFHPYLYQKELLNFCQKNSIVVTAYSPLGRGEIFNNEVILDLANEYEKSPAQLALKWLIDKDIVAIPKASSEEHLKDNLDIFDWDLTAEAREKIDSINKNMRIIDPGFGEFDK